MELFKVLTPEEELAFRKWARDTWKHGSTVDDLWHPVVRAEIAQMQAEYPALLAVSRNEALAKGIPVPVVDAVVKAWTDQAVEILGQLQRDCICNFWYFTRWGMFVGVEPDGYIHT